ncbi:MAG: hypothetical protein LJE91_16395 [Gammaproteobacteria bacterium]|jgi:hypothetical protein|nr:hypothetical protein [Gammaproteobacteria bacterium]
MTDDDDKTQMFGTARQDSPAPDATLTRTSPDGDSPDSIPLTGEGVSLKSAPDGSVSLADPAKARFRFFQVNGVWGGQALAEDSPLIVNGKPITLSFLKSGDDIDFDGTHYVFRWDNESENKVPTARERAPASDAGGQSGHGVAVSPHDAPPSASQAPGEIPIFSKPRRKRFSGPLVAAIVLVIVAALVLGLTLL